MITRSIDISHFFLAYNCYSFDNSIIDIINNATEELIELCDGNIGCVIDGVMLGTDGADTFLEEQEETNSTDPSLNETILGTTSSELFVDDEESSEDDAPVSPAGSLGDPHCKVPKLLYPASFGTYLTISVLSPFLHSPHLDE